MTVAAWNKPLPVDGSGRPTATLHANNTTIMARVNSWTGSYPLSPTIADTTSDFNHPVFFAKSTDPQFIVAQGASGGAYEGPYTIRIPQAARPARGGDGHMCVIASNGIDEYDLWDVTTDAGSNTRLVNLPSGGGTIYARGVGHTLLNGSGQNTGSGDATAAKFGLLAGPFRGEELANQRIGHALWFTTQGHNGSFIFPALASGGSGGFDHADAPPMGARFFINYSTAEVEALAIPRYRKTIIHALREFGAIVGDAGGSPIDLQPLSGTTYTALGLADPFRTYMTSQGVTGSVDWRTGVDWSRLRVAAASVSQ
jgi:hypothetical protein